LYITIKIKVMGRGRPSKKIAPKVSFVRTGRPVSEKIVVCVVYKKPTGKKYYLNTYKNLELDSISNLTNTGSFDITPNQYPLPCPESSGSLIYSYIGGVATVYSASYFAGGVAPTLTIDP
jgi:hypothetical protein